MENSSYSQFPATRLRRLRQNPAVRRLVQEITLAPSNMVLPLFVRPGKGLRQPIGSMPGHAQISPDQLPAELEEVQKLGLGGVILFGIPETKDATGSDSTSDGGIVQQALAVAKKSAPDVLVMTDVCFCEYTSHGHCGVVNDKSGRIDVDNDATLELIAAQALSHARAGADIDDGARVAERFHDTRCDAWVGLAPVRIGAADPAVVGIACAAIRPAFEHACASNRHQRSFAGDSAKLL